LAEPERRLAAIMFTDMVGYSALTQADEPRALRLLEVHRSLLRPIVLKHGGSVVKMVGDGTLVEFASALAAVLCAVDLQSAFRDHNQKAGGEDSVALRIGIHLGDVVHREDDVYGDAVNVASRIEPLAEPGGICVSEQVFGQVRNKIQSRMVKLPPQKLKNIEVPFDIFRVVLPWESEALVQPGVRFTPASNIRRIGTGVEGLDTATGGGLPTGSTTMVYGAPKSGKSVFAYQFLAESIRRKEPCLFVMTDYGAGELSRAMLAFGWDMGDSTAGEVRLVDITSAQAERQLEGSAGTLQYGSVTNLKELMSLCEGISSGFLRRGLSFRTVLDSLTPLFIYNPPVVVAKFLRQFAAGMKAAGSSGVVVTYVEDSVDPRSELFLKSSVENLLHLRDGEILVEGMLGTPKARMAYKIGARGLEVGA
jgi:class 3 adenylate cyclase/KaiC/GvpD/RAD55 family RecA-like ATPase